VVVATGVYFSTRPSVRSNGQVTTPGRSTALNLRVGDCVSLQSRFTPSAKRVTTVPCTTPHNGQVYSLQFAPAGPFPGVTQAYAAALTQCQAAVAGFLGRPPADLHVRVVLTGDAKNWDDASARTEACILYDRTRTFTGDIRALS
jgi:hypothetical protein